MNDVPLAPRWYGGKTEEVQEMFRDLIRGAVDQNARCVLYPDDYTGYDEEKPPTAEEAEALCRGCPLQKLCYDYATASKATYGVWGGKVFVPKDEEAE